MPEPSPAPWIAPEDRACVAAALALLAQQVNLVRGAEYRERALAIAEIVTIYGLGGHFAEAVHALPKSQVLDLRAQERASRN